MEKNSKAPIYIALLTAVILIAAGGYYVFGGGSNEPKVKEKNTQNAKFDGSMSYYFIDRDNGGVTIMLTGTPSHSSSKIDALENGLSKLRSICKVQSYEVLSYDDGETNAYSVTVDEPCNPN